MESLYDEWPRWRPQVNDIVIRRTLDPLQYWIGVVWRTALREDLYRGGLVDVWEWSHVSGQLERKCVYPGDLKFLGGLDSLGVSLIERNNDNDEAE